MLFRSGLAEMQIVSGADSSVQARIGYVDALDGRKLVIYLPVTAAGDVVFELRAK